MVSIPLCIPPDLLLDGIKWLPSPGHGNVPHRTDIREGVQFGDFPNVIGSWEGGVAWSAVGVDDY